MLRSCNIKFQGFNGILNYVLFFSAAVLYRPPAFFVFSFAFNALDCEKAVGRGGTDFGSVG